MLVAWKITPPIQGINLGGWMILEKFITPSLFQNQSVLSLWDYVAIYRNDSEKMQALWNHWDTWIQEEDIRKLAVIGFTHVRLPVGYWTFVSQDELDKRGEQFVTGQLPLLERCIYWLKKYSIKVIVDLHGAPGSQNGWDNSGRYTNNPLWGTGDTLNRTLEVIETISQWILQLETYQNTSDTIVGLELINEAAPFRLQNIGIGYIQQYYLTGHSIVRKYLPADRYAVVIEMAFCFNCWTNFMNSSQYNNTLLDLHIYQCFDTGEQQASYQAHLDISCNIQSTYVSSQTLPSFVGEWSVAYKMDSGSAYYEPYPDPSQISFMSQFALSQLKIYDSHFFWNFKTESAPMWDYFLGYQKWLPELPSVNASYSCGGNGTLDWTAVTRQIPALDETIQRRMLPRKQIEDEGHMKEESNSSRLLWTSEMVMMIIIPLLLNIS